MERRQFITGSEATVMGALDAGAEAMYGYPITPATEILQGWIAKSIENNKLFALQTEDETSAGFATIGALLAGKKAFTATAGPGTILMQDPLSMAENLRLPFVLIAMQRGGPSTGTVNYSQQEVNLAAFGGNGDGLRIVYSASTVEELYYLTAKSFSTAWKYRFPTVLLGDGHLAKMRTEAEIVKAINPVKSRPILAEQKAPTFLRNCYSDEESFGQKLKEDIDAWNEARRSVVLSEQYRTDDATDIIVAHGSVAEAAKGAISILRNHGRKIGLFRPITIHPLDTGKLIKTIAKAKKVYIVESSLNQLARIVKYETAGMRANFIEVSKPAESFSAEEIAKKISII